MSFFGIVVAAGKGERFGGNKHDLVLGDKPLWRWARDALIDGGATDVVVVGSVPGGIEGGARRRDSVAAGLAAGPEGVPFVLIHDAARPLASADLVRRVAGRVQKGDVGGVVPVMPVRDTLKRVSGDVVDETLDRAGVFAVQTPQGFDAAELRAAHAADDDDASDDAILVERHGGVVATVSGEDSNIKVTYRSDMALVEALLR